jgi:predicted dehydrogenase
MWMGEVTSVAGVMGKALGHMAGASMSQHVFKFASGKSAIFESMLAPTAIADQPFFHVQGTEGEIVIDGFGGGLRLFTAEGEQTVCKEICKEGWDKGYHAEYCDFAAAVLDGTPLAAEAESAAADVRVTLAMVQADEAEAWVSVPTSSRGATLGGAVPAKV